MRFKLLFKLLKTNKNVKEKLCLEIYSKDKYSDQKLSLDHEHFKL